MKFAIMHESVTNHDAIGNDIEGMFIILNEHHLCRVYANHRKNDRVTYISEQELERWMESPDTVIIYHHSVYWEHGYQKIKRFKGNIIFRYHNITPEHFFQPFNEQYYKTCKYGREQTLLMIKDHPTAYWLSDSQYNSRELVVMDDNRKDVCPPFHKIEDWSEIKPDETILRRLIETNALNVLFVGRIVPNKGYLNLLEVVRTYVSCYEEGLHLRIIGKYDNDLLNYNEIIKKQIRKYHLKSMVEFIGETDDSTLLSYYLASDAMLCCSEHEGFFVPGIEAQSLGLPVIAFSESAIPETLGENQLLFDQNVYQCAAALRFIHKNDEGKNFFIRSGIRNYQSRFTSKIIRKQFISAIERMVGVAI